MNTKIETLMFKSPFKMSAACLCAIFVLGITVMEEKIVFCEEIIESSHQVILDKKPDKIVSAGFWRPTNRQTAEALRAINKYLAKLSKTKKEDMPAITTQNSTALTISQVSKIHDGLWKYRVQFIGIKFDNRQVIYCNFFTYDHDKYAGWKHEYVDVSVGGSSFWQIDYDPNTKQCSDLTINSEDLKHQKEPNANSK